MRRQRQCGAYLQCMRTYQPLGRERRDGNPVLKRRADSLLGEGDGRAGTVTLVSPGLERRKRWVTLMMIPAGAARALVDDGDCAHGTYMALVIVEPL